MFKREYISGMKKVSISKRIAITISILSQWTTGTVLAESQFEPYVLNGGLVSAIAGKDYLIIASDSRLTDGGYEILSREYLSSRIWSATDVDCHCIKHDGSLVLPSDTIVPTSMESDRNSYNYFHSCPTFITSSGCASDCESLKRQLRSEINAHMHWNHGSKTLTPTGVANLLSQTLYSRRSFPFYSFCILAGMEQSGHAHVHVYDAIGSHERVGIASAGNGKEMLQPILDRLFSSEGPNDTIPHGTRLQRDDRAVLASQQRVGLKLQPPVGTHVLCDCKMAEALLVKGYRSVAEREISIGDNIVVCVIQREEKNAQSEENVFSMQVKRYPLKQH